MSARQTSHTPFQAGDSARHETDLLSPREARRLRILSKWLGALLVASLIHMAIAGTTGATAVAVVLTAVLFAGSLWLSAKISGSSGP